MRRPLLAALGGGGIAALSLPPWGWWPLGVLGLGVAAYAILDLCAEGSWRWRAATGAAFGLGMFLPGLWWVTEFHVVGYVVLTLLETAYFAATFAFVRTPASFVGAVVLAEFLRNTIPFGGLPLGGLALGQAGGPFVASARIGGALLVLFVVAAIAVAPRRSAMAVVGVVLALAGWVAPGGHDIGDGDGTLDVAVVQGGGRRGFRAVGSDADDVLAAHLAASRGLHAPLDLVLWPENAIDVIEIDGSAAGEALAAVARRTDATVIAGVTEDEGDDGFENVAIVWSPDGEIVDRFTKVQRVPFGEWVPGRGLFERLVDLSALPRDAVAGDEAGAIESPAGTFAVTISYEVFFASRARSGVRDGGEVLLVPTNAASFSTSQVPGQEIAAARLRAWETGRWVLQAAPTGYSAVIDERGRVLSRSSLGDRDVLLADVPRRGGSTWSVRFGDWPIVLLALALVAGSMRRQRQRQL